MATKELIYKDDTRRAILKANPSLAYCIDNIKAVDAKPIVRGKWEYWAGSLARCPVCGYEYTDYLECDNFCGYCGADMRGVEDGY